MTNKTNKTDKTAEKRVVEVTLRNDLERLENAFYSFNEKLFDGKLPKPIITLQRDTEKAKGWYTKWKAWKLTDWTEDDERGFYEINICPDYTNRPCMEVLETLVHEMVHMFCNENDISDTSKKGTYHNKRFKEQAEKHGLTTFESEKHGYLTDGFNDVGLKVAAEVAKELHFDFWRYQPPKAKATKKPKTMFKYVCPKCGAKVWSNKRVNVKCGDCELTMTDEEE